VRRFELNRLVDPTGVSGTGVVAVGVHIDDDGEDVAVVRWMTEYRSTVLYTPCNGYTAMEQVEKIHGHNGSTEIRFLDD
jgi:hypothetical protein